MPSGTNARDARVTELFGQLQHNVVVRTDHNFALLMVVQFVFGVAAALWISPHTWTGDQPSVHIHVWASILLGGLITVLPVFLAWKQPGHVLTRHVIAVGQMLMGALLIHLTGGRIETHFHVFGSLAFLAFYRDWKVLVTATVVVALDHCLRGLIWPQSIFGSETVEYWRWLEHTAWVLFEDLFLFVSIQQSVGQMWALAQRQADLEKSKSHVESERDRFFELSVDMLCVANIEGYFERVNPTFSEVLGYSSDELLNRPFFEFIHPDDQTRTAEVMGKLQEGGDVVDFENRYRCSDGHYVWLSWSSRAAAKGDSHVYAVARDVTAKKLAAQTLVDARETAEHARAAAEHANRAKSDFLANMSHEIRTPMNAVIGLTELVLESELTTTQRDYMGTVLESGESLLSIINEILDFSKIEAGKIELEVLPFHLRDELGDIMRSLALRAHRKGLELAWHAEADVPDDLMGDPARLRQVLVNLAGNAIKFTETGEVVLSVKCQSVNETEVNLRFELRDTGVGIAEEKRDAIFAEFEQADTSTTREFGGTGLGLSISSRLVELMGGKIEVDSKLEQGSTFYFSVKFPRTAAPSQSFPPPEIGKLEGLRVMIVDDNPTNRTILQETIESWRMSPICVDSGKHAIELLMQMRRDGRLPSVILTDVHMPEMDGIELVRQLRTIHHLDSDTVIIALTSGGLLDSTLRNTECGFAAQLQKPVKQSELLESILEAIAPMVGSLCSVEDDVVGDEFDASSIPSLKVLLAEDGLANQKLAIGLLSKWGHEVEIASNGQEAVEQWAAGQFDLILMDLQMPVMDGITATKEIRKRESEVGAHIPIIAMTAHALKGDRELCLESGMDGYISKPVRQKDLLKALQPLFARPDL
ncbi:MAG: response regulator [Rubripirellula sp.]